MRIVARALATLVVLGCAREPLETPCPDVEPGDLVLSEIRGPQAGSADPFGQWVEVYNASGTTVSLTGLSLAMRKIDGSGAAAVIVRSDDTDVAAGGYVVLGRFARGSEPAHVSYGFRSDLDADLYPAAELVLSACGETIDRTVYRTLPTAGTLAFDGDRTPSADANDVESAWCADTDGEGLPGTPLGRNNPCDP